MPALLPGEAGGDPIEDRLHETVRATIEALFDEETAAHLGRIRYRWGGGARRAIATGGEPRVAAAVCALAADAVRLSVITLGELACGAARLADGPRRAAPGAGSPGSSATTPTASSTSTPRPPGCGVS